MDNPISILWMRRDLRLEDNAALYHALRGPNPVLPVFIFDTGILDQLPRKDDARVNFLHEVVAGLHAKLKALGSTLLVAHGKPLEVFSRLVETMGVAALYYNRDYEPGAMERDDEVRALLLARGIPAFDFKDHVIFERDEVHKDDGTPYTVFTPYGKKWRRKLEDIPSGAAQGFYFKSYPTEKHFHRFAQVEPAPLPSLEQLGFSESSIPFPPSTVSSDLIRKYAEQRDIPGIQGTSRLGIHFRFGTISIRAKARRAQQLNDTYLNELIWRDFYSMILQAFPHVDGSPFRPEYGRIQWRNDMAEFDAWREGRTGFPIVDAGMRELSATGFMHNRVRMIVASFLTKQLLIDWRWGEAWFAELLLDYDLASNNGGWQWAAGCGTDAAPYFRIFNPITQQERFDPKFDYVRQWVPEYGTPAYPKPIVDLSMARERCLAAYKLALAPQ